MSFNYVGQAPLAGDSGERYFYALRRDDDGQLFISKVDKASPTDAIQINRPETPYSDGPPCIELMAQNKIGEGGRNNALFHYGVYAKQKWPGEWKSKLILFNATAMEQPLSDLSLIHI